MAPAATTRAAEPEMEGAYAALGEQLERLVREQDWAGGEVAFAVEDATLRIRVLGLRADAAVQPGSLMQIVTAAAALDQLGADYRFATELLIGGRMEGKTLKGAVVAHGTGDPSLSLQYLEKPAKLWAPLDRWARLLRKRGIRRVEGPVIGDDRAFAPPAYGVGWPVDRLGDPSLPTVSALNLNHNCVTIEWQAGRKARRIADCRVYPGLPHYLNLSNNVRVADPARQPLRVERTPGSNLLNATGDIAPRARVQARAAIEDPAEFFARALRERLAERGIEVSGSAASAGQISPAEIPEELQLIDTLQSPPLVDLLRHMMREDSTLEAEVILKTLGRRAGPANQPGSWEAGARAVERVLDGWHLPTGYAVVDGSGRSDHNRLSMSQLVRIERQMLAHPAGAAFAELLPRAGQRGPLADRFTPAPRAESDKEEPEPSGPAPAIQAKPASAPGMEALAGFVETRSGRRLAFAIHVSGSRLPARTLRTQIDALVVRLSQARI